MNQGQSTPALFLDRDGIINKDIGYLNELNKLEFVEGIFELCKYFKSMNYKLIIVTNQSGVGRGIFPLERYYEIMEAITSKFSEHNIEFDLILASTLNPESKIISNFESYRRKPNPGLILDASEIMNIDLKNSILVGDKLTDIIAGRNAGIRMLYLLTNEKLDLEGDELFNCDKINSLHQLLITFNATEMRKE